MKIQGSYRFPYPRPLVWQALLDPEVLARTMPGCEQLERENETRFAGSMKVAVGPVKGTFKGTLELSALDPGNGYRMKLDGSGQAGYLSGEGTIALADDGDGTNLAYDLDAKIGGKIAGVGQRLLDASAKVITRQGLEGLEAQLAALAAATATAAPPPAPAPASAASTPAATGQPAPASDVATPATLGAPATAPVSAPAPTPAPARPAPPAPAAPSTTAFAGRFLVGLLGELIPPERRALYGTIAVAILITGVLLLLRACG